MIFKLFMIYGWIIINNFFYQMIEKRIKLSVLTEQLNKNCNVKIPETVIYKESQLK